MEFVQRQLNNTRTRVLIARSESQTGDYSGAREQLRHVADAQPESLEDRDQQESGEMSRWSNHLLANLRMATGHNEAARTFYQKLLAENPDDPIVLNNLG